MTGPAPAARELQVLQDLRRMDSEEQLFVRALKVLYRSPAVLTGRQVAGRLQVSPTTAIGCLEHLLDLGAVTKAKRGSANVWALTPPAVAFLTNRR